jgi:hypothetical protein
MAVQYPVAQRNLMLEAKATNWGASPVMKLWTGAQPATCATANSGTECASGSLPATPFAAAAAGAIAKNGTWTITGTTGGTAGHYRVYKSDGTTCVEQGDITDDMTIDNAVIANGQVVTITAYSTTAGNA